MQKIKILLFLIMFFLLFNYQAIISKENKEELDLIEIKDKLYNQSDGIFFSLSKFKPQKLLNYNIIIDNIVDNKEKNNNDLSNFDSFPLKYYKIIRFEKNLLSKINNNEDLEFVKNCYIKTEKAYEIKKDLDLNSLTKLADIIKINNIKLQTDINQTDYWNDRFKNRNTILDKMKYDFKLFGLYNNNNLNKSYKILPTIEIVYSKLYGNIFRFTILNILKINFKVYKDDVEIFDKSYLEIYNTDGSDEDYEGGFILFSFNEFHKICMGISLRKLLDKFYIDLENVAD